MYKTKLPAIISNPTSAVRHCVIWLHGLGASGNDFVPIVDELGIQDSLGIRFIFPHAPQIPVAINGGMVMPAWYDITEIDLMKRADKAGITHSSATITSMINDEIASGIKASNIVIAGFSQGGVIALDAGLRFSKPLAGIMALSTYIPMQDSLPSAEQSGNTNVPIFYGHGEFDPVIPISQARTSQQFLESSNYSVEIHDYPIEHSVSPQEIIDIRLWLHHVFNA